MTIDNHDNVIFSILNLVKSIISIIFAVNNAKANEYSTPSQTWQTGHTSLQSQSGFNLC